MLQLHVAEVTCKVLICGLRDFLLFPALVLKPFYLLYSLHLHLTAKHLTECEATGHLQATVNSSFKPKINFSLEKIQLKYCFLFPGLFYTLNESQSKPVTQLKDKTRHAPEPHLGETIKPGRRDPLMIHHPTRTTTSMRWCYRVRF